MDNQNKNISIEDAKVTRPHKLLDPNPEILRYTTNKFSFWFIILAIVFNCLAFLDYYGKKNVKPDFYLGLDVLINILVLLGCFVTAEEVKAYRVKFGFCAFGLAIIQVARIFFIPFRYMSALIEYGSFVYIIILYVLSAVALVVGGIICLLRARVLNSYLESLENEEEVK